MRVKYHQTSDSLNTDNIDVSTEIKGIGKLNLTSPNGQHNITAQINLSTVNVSSELQGNGKLNLTSTSNEHTINGNVNINKLTVNNTTNTQTIKGLTVNIDCPADNNINIGHSNIANVLDYSNVNIKGLLYGLCAALF